jgi:hypothetical protein
MIQHRESLVTFTHLLCSSGIYAWESLPTPPLSPLQGLKPDRITLKPRERG